MLSVGAKVSSCWKVGSNEERVPHPPAFELRPGEYLAIVEGQPLVDIYVRTDWDDAYNDAGWIDVDGKHEPRVPAGIYHFLAEHLTHLPKSGIIVPRYQGNNAVG